MSHDTIPVPVNHNGLLEQTVSYTCRVQFIHNSLCTQLTKSYVAKPSVVAGSAAYMLKINGPVVSTVAVSLYKIIHIMHTASHACHMTCSEEQSKLCVSSMCCRSRPGVQTSTLMRWIQACSSRRSFPPITSPAETSWRRPTCRRTSKVW